jgi:hypothetical protein
MKTKKSHHRTSITFIFLVGIFFLGCDSFLATPIDKILENPRDYDGKQVMVSGEVTEIFSFFAIKYFVVKDKTGEIVVVTQRPLPKKGIRIRAKGTVEEAFSLGDRQLIVIREEGKK